MTNGADHGHRGIVLGCPFGAGHDLPIAMFHCMGLLHERRAMRNGRWYAPAVGEGGRTLRRPGARIAALLTLLLAACSGGPTLAPPATSRPEGPPRISLPVEPGSTVEGLVDVNGHDLYARCAGKGSPTVLYFTGWADDLAKRAVAIATGIEAALGPAVRVCSYERRNTGRSETVQGTQSPEDVIADIDGFLTALGEDGPFLLLGASFGGLVASAYAVAHPDRVAGVVLLDASPGNSYEIEEKGGPACLPANREADANDSLEKLDNCSLSKWIHDRRDREPDVPLLYLAASDSPDRGSPFDAAARAWVATWSPGKWRVVSAPHWMDEADTELVAAAIREVIDQTR
jgi:pimeloyl-ACP methyl ester carboxylesterase